jgi:hypothetical protein
MAVRTNCRSALLVVSYALAIAGPPLATARVSPFSSRLRGRGASGLTKSCSSSRPAYSIGLFLRISPMLQVFDLSRRFSENRFPLFGTPL